MERNIGYICQIITDPQFNGASASRYSENVPDLTTGCIQTVGSDVTENSDL